jgi:tetratricopeptide (TPR) repeat protein
MLAGGDDAGATCRRHAEAFLAFAQDAAPHLSGVEQRTWLDRLEREHDNLRAALDWATEHDPTLATRMAFALWRFWQQRGYLNEARTRLEAMAALGWDLEPADRARFAETIGGVAYWQSDREAARTWYEVALAIWRELGDRAEIANALFNRAYADMIVVMQGQGDRDTLSEGGALLDEALAIYRELGDKGGEGNVVWGLGSFHYFTADPATAEVWFRRSLDLHREAGHRTMEAWSLHMLTLAAAGQRHWDMARETGRHALQHFYEASDVSGVILVLDDLSIVAIAEDDRVRAGRLWGAARHLQQSTGTGLANYIDQNFELLGVPTPRDVLTGDELAAYVEEGIAMGFDELVAYALDVEEGPVPGTHMEADR